MIDTQIQRCSTNYLMKTVFSDGWTDYERQVIRDEIARRWMSE